MDTTGLSPAQVAELAEQTLTKRTRKPRNNVAEHTEKVPEKPAKHRATVKSAEKAPKKPRGRPSSYSPQVAEAIVDRLTAGEPLREICRDETMPAWRTVYDWMRAHSDFSTRIADARDLGEDALAQECLSIADDASNDWMEKYDKDGDCIGWQLNHDHVQRSKLRIETRLKLLAKWNPKKWGEKVDLNHGGQKDNPITTLLQRINGTALKVKE